MEDNNYFFVQNGEKGKHSATFVAIPADRIRQQ